MIQGESSMQAKPFSIIAFVVLGLMLLSVASQPRAEATSTAYPVAAALDQYLIPDRNSEIALARAAAPKSISGAAEVMVLGRDGYSTAVKGSNGFVCLVIRSWSAPTDVPEFWNPKIRAPQCLNAQAARTYLPEVMLKTKLVVAGKLRSEIAQAVSSAYERKELPALAPGGVSYMMARQQYLNDAGGAWHPHVMWFVPGDVVDESGANVAGSPVLAINEAENHLTILMVKLGHWSDGTSASQGAQTMAALHTNH
jgi:hypothetical protein